MRRRPVLLVLALIVALVVSVPLLLSLGDGGDEPGPSSEGPEAREPQPPPGDAVASYYVSPSGDDGNDGRSSDRPLQTIQTALELAQPGSTVVLAPGRYLQDLRSVRDGTAAMPITITGPKEAVLHGGGASEIVGISHDHHVLQGFTVDGHFASGSKASSYRKKLLYAQGTEPRDGVSGLRVLDMTLTNALDECVRLRYFARDNEIAGNTITNCGIEDFRLDGDEKNGEGIYIGTAPEQLRDERNPTRDADESNGNHIHDNTIDTDGNECVGIKEGSSDNLIEDNDCTGQRDSDSAGLDTRGNGNIFRRNTVYGNSGAGIRLGGDESGDGIDNDVYENVIRDNEAGGIKFQARPQGRVCGNTMSDNDGGNAVGDYREQFDPTARCPSGGP